MIRPTLVLRRHVLRFECRAKFGGVRDAMAQLRRDAGGTLDDVAALLLMARHAFGGPVDDGRASYQIELSICEDCWRARQQGGGELVEVAARSQRWLNAMRSGCRLTWVTRRKRASEPRRTFLPPFDAKCCAVDRHRPEP